MITVLITVEEALSRMLTGLVPLPLESVALTHCLGRVLAEDMFTDISMPAFTNSAVDGYAVRAQDIVSASARTPVLSTCLGEILAGDWPAMTIREHTCARIMTGAPLPAGADAVVMQEETTLAAPDRVHIREMVNVGQHVRFAGEDVRNGDLVLRAGTLLGPAAIGLLAQIGREKIPVIRVPRVAVFSTGDEVIEVEEGLLPPPGKIRNSNSYALAAQVQQAGAQVVTQSHLPDDLAATQAALRQVAQPGSASDTVAVHSLQSSQTEKTDTEKTETEFMGVDIIVTAGGVSVGARDFVKPALESLGTLDFWRVAMKPGKPVAFGRIGRTLFFGLPGNPVSAQVTFELFVRPVLWKLAGRPASQLARRQVEAILLEAVPHIPGRREYVRAITEWRSGHYQTRPAGGQSSANGHSLALANSLLIVPEDAEMIAAGTLLSVLLLE